MNYQFFWQPFFYPFFLSIVYFFSGPSIVCAKVVQSILGSITCVLTYLLGKRLFNRKVGLAAGIAVSLYGPLIFFEAELLASGWEAFWSVALVLLFLSAASENKTWLWVLLGLCGALSIVTRPTFLLFFAAGCLWLLIFLYRKKSPPRELVTRFIILIVSFLLVTIPVASQNKKITGHFGILPASGGLNFYIGNNPDYMDTLNIRPGWDWNELMKLPERNGVIGDLWQQQKFFYDRFKDFIRTQPLQYVRGLAYKTIQFLNSRELPRNVDLYLFGKWSWLLRILTWKKGGFGFPFGVLLPLTFCGSFYYRKQIPAIVILFLVFYPLSIILVFVCGRYRVAVVPIMAVVAAAGLFGLVEMVKQSRWICIGSAVICGAALLFLSSIPALFPVEKINYEAELYANLADTKISRGEYEQAINYLEKSLKLEPNSGMAYASLATALFRKGDSKQAVKYYQESLRFKPDSLEVLNNLGATMSSLGEFDKAQEYYRRSLKINPYNVRIHVNLGNALFRKGNYEAAIESYTQAITINPRHAKAYLSRGYAYQQTGQLTAAEEDYLKALQIDPDNAAAYLNLGNVYFELGRTDEAIGRYEKALKIDSGFAQARSQLAWMYNYKAKELIEQNKNAEAISYLSKAVNLAPAEINNHILLAETLVKQNQYDEAVKVLEKAIGFTVKIGNKEAESELRKALEHVQSRRNKGTFR
jgi:tetratricopeptide (TPR) repeat protein